MSMHNQTISSGDSSNDISSNSIPPFRISGLANVGVVVNGKLEDMLSTRLLAGCIGFCLLGCRTLCRTGGNAISSAISMMLNTRHVTPSATVTAEDTTLFWTGGRFIRNCATCDIERANRQQERRHEINTSNPEEVRPVHHPKGYIELKSAKHIHESEAA